jgi:serine/threonine protein kinase
MTGIRRIKDAVDLMSEPENAFHAPSPEELAPLFPKYQILSLIATGGMGAVYHAIQTSLERQVAIKILPVEFGKDPEFCEGFTAEARVMARLNHPNLISVYDFGEINEMLFIVMEYVPGLSVHGACNGSPLDPAEAIRLLTAICQGLAHAHQNGILHRDIKPANILLDSQLQPKIGDFGLARPLDAQVGEGEAIFGTPGYTAPEVLQAPHTMDQRADIFSLGVLLHELLTGMLPGSDPRPASAIVQCDPRLDAVVRKATHPNPLQRYQNAAEIADALQKIASTAGPKAFRTAPTAATRKPAARLYPTQSSSKGGAIWWVILLLLLVIALAVFIFSNPEADPVPAPTPVVEHPPEPVPPEPVPPATDPVVAQPDPVQPAPDPVATLPDPVATVPEPLLPEPGPVQPEPGPVAADPATPPAIPDSVTTPQPKLDVNAFLAHARAVMAERCKPEIVKRDEALVKNLADFRSDAIGLSLTNLTAEHHRPFERELDDFLAEREEDGNRIGESLVQKLKFKKWLVELHEKYQQKEAAIDEQLMDALAEHQNTYLHGLGIRIKALQQDDPAAADLIKAETGKVAASPDYFAGLMQEAIKN